MRARGAISRCLPALLMALGTGLALAGLIYLAREVHDVHILGRAAKEFGPAEDGGGADLAALEEWNPAVVAWLTVPGAGISLPVVQATSDNPEYWLSHALTGEDSLAGTPFIDARTSAGARHVLVFGHHLTGVGGVFSGLYDLWHQDAFDERLAAGATWQTRAGGTSHFAALCALRVPSSWAPIQTFSWEGGQDAPAGFREWLSALVDASSAHSDEASALIPHATRCLTLVTCSSRTSGQPWRTLVVFVDG